MKKLMMIDHQYLQSYDEDYEDYSYDEDYEDYSYDEDYDEDFEDYEDSYDEDSHSHAAFGSRAVMLSL